MISFFEKPLNNVWVVYKDESFESSKLQKRLYWDGILDRELRDKETKIKKEMEEHFFELVNVSIDDMDKFEKN